MNAVEKNVSAKDAPTKEISKTCKESSKEQLTISNKNEQNA